jgi:hypothetical protein
VKDVTFFRTTVVFAAIGETAILSNGSLESYMHWRLLALNTCLLSGCSRLATDFSQIINMALAHGLGIYLPQVLNERAIQKDPDL